VQTFKVVQIASGERDPSTSAVTLDLSEEDEGSLLQLSCARDHKVAYCQSPTRCWRSRQFEHTSEKCLPSNSGQSSFNCSCISEGISTPPHFASATTVEGNLLLSNSPPALERLEDPMLLEESFMSHRLNAEGGTST
jgi:hypothetical protein